MGRDYRGYPAARPPGHGMGGRPLGPHPPAPRPGGSRHAPQRSPQGAQLMETQRLGRRKLPPLPRAVSRPDWQWIRAEWEADMKSNEQIAAQSTASGRKVTGRGVAKRAEREGWKRASLTQETRMEVQRRLVSAAVPVVQGVITRNDLVDAAARQGVEVVRQHRQAIGTAATVVKAMMGQLIEATEHAADLEQLIHEETQAAPDATQAEIETRAERRARLMRTIGLRERAQIARDLTHAMRNLIGLERQAFNLNDSDGGDSFEDRLRRLG